MRYSSRRGSSHKLMIDSKLLKKGEGTPKLREKAQGHAGETVRDSSRRGSLQEGEL
jgi:hypothetical protein